MAVNFLQEGETLDYTNTGTSAILSGSVVPVAAMVCIALGDIAPTETGILATEGVWEVPKVAGAAINQGTKPIWDASAGAFVASGTPSSGDISGAVVAWETASASATKVAVKLIGGAGSLT